MSIVINNVSKRFGGFTALDNVNLEVPDGALLALLGPSGSGKTTLLRIIAGLEVPDSGNVLQHQEDITHHSARDRKVGFVFQHYALFRHMNVAENIGFGLRMRKTPKGEIRSRVTELLNLIRLEGLGTRYPGQLSGGQRQRVALARALAAQPSVLLLDEPFGALDAKVRQELRQWLRRLHKEIHVTSIFVTHDQEEALEVADRVVVMNEGRIEQVGSPEEVYDHPATPFVYNFLGNVNLFHGRIHQGRAHIGDIEIEAPEHADAEHVPAVAYVRPHDFEISLTPNGGKAWFEATVDQLLAVGPVARLDLKRQDSEDPIQAEISREQYRDLNLSEGDRVFVRPRRLKFFAEN
ncbi:MAG: sulfate/molybdate ABC transporter ATP-binding protein [Candidatus Dadabacteria bacterium]|nr:MAG: sulfate/molybdate ABC transporter ATP-binding protein [Candidatus Dadabacteria bacterium]